MQDLLKEQFSGFLNTPRLPLENFNFSYDFFRLTKNPELDSADIPSPPTMVLGKRMETFFQYYVQNFTNEMVIAHNEQIIDDKLTVGEIDFLLKNESSSLVSHVELVYKFYLYDPSLGSREEDRWIGPNRRDSLVKKLTRLKTRQFPLLFHPATRPLLDSLGITAEEISQKICFKASLFLPFLERNNIPSGISEDAVKGFYLGLNDFTEKMFPGADFFSPRKPDWPVSPEKNNTWYSFEEIKMQVEKMHKKQQSPLLWMKTPENEHFRFFVVWW
ncbi:DUF1853 family protein [Salinimicrobium soli]|uniref:DUF1853 family protein n=1 Tax=Salinimicrobium soli TaxID=1254399 RepID=UPI003AADD935